MSTYQVTLINNLDGIRENEGSAFETKLAKPLDLPGKWRVSIMDISYPHQWTTINENLHYGILLPMYECGPEYEQSTILHREQPAPENAQFVQTERPFNLTMPQRRLWQDIRYINFMDGRCRYELKVDSIDEGEHKDAASIVRQMNNKLQGMYRKRFPEQHQEEPVEFIKYNPLKRRVRFNNLRQSRYIIVAPSHSSIINMLGYGSRCVKLKTRSNRQLDVLIVEHIDVAHSRFRMLNPLRKTEKVNLRILDNVFIYSDIVEQSLIGTSQANIIGFFPIKSSFGETGYWCFNPPYDYQVIKSYIDTISIKLCRENGELFPFRNGKIIIRLLFKRES